MRLSSQQQQIQQICKVHQLKLKYLNSLNPNDKLLCRLCLDEINATISIKSINKEIINNINQQYNQNLNIFEQLQCSVKQFEESLVQGITIIENIVEAIRTQIQNTKLKIQQLQQNSQQQMNVLKLHEKFLQEERNFKNNIAEYLEMIKFDKNINELIQQLDEFDFQSLDQQYQQQLYEIEKIVKQPSLDQSSIEINQVDIKTYDYELLTQSTLKLWGEHCYAMDINNDITKVAVGCYHIIKVFDFNNNQLCNSQLLKGHDNQVNSIQFFKKCNRFLSTGCDQQINLWQQNEKNEWIIIYNLNDRKRAELQINPKVINKSQKNQNNSDALTSLLITSFQREKWGHSDIINCIIINQNENMILTGSKDQTIISWILNDDGWVLDQYLKCQSQVWSLSLNESNTKLISCEQIKSIKVFEIQDNQWIYIQNIKFENQGFRLGFVSDSEFAFLPQKSKWLLFYKLNYQIDKFEVDYQADVNTGNEDECGFPLSFIKSKNILIVKNCQYLNILSKQSDGMFILNYSIQFSSYNFYGCVSSDGEYLITRDTQAIKYQIRKLKEKK